MRTLLSSPCQLGLGVALRCLSLSPYNSCLFKVVISCILLLKNFLLVNWTNVLKVFQLTRLLWVW